MYFVDRHPLARVLPVGPRSVLFGAHHFIIHPVFVELAWRKLYKKKPTWRERVGFVVHDLGYLRGSSDGKRVAVGNGSNNNVLLYDFDNAAGVLNIASARTWATGAI